MGGECVAGGEKLLDKVGIRPDSNFPWEIVVDDVDIAQLFKGWLRLEVGH